MAYIVVFDDDHVVQLLLESTLKVAGHEVVSHAPVSHFEALGMLRARVPDLVVLDLIMPGCSGMGLLQFIREDPYLRALKVIIFTANKEQLLMEDLLEELPDAIIFKPLHRVEFLAYLDEVLSRDVHSGTEAH